MMNERTKYILDDFIIYGGTLILGCIEIYTIVVHWEEIISKFQ